MNEEKFSTKVINEAKSLVGTWSCQSITEISERLQKFNSVSVNSFIREVLIFVIDQETTNDVRFKIAQLLISLKSFFLPKVAHAISHNSELMNRALASIQEGKLKEATTSLYTNLISSVKVVRPVKATTHIKSMSVQPSKTIVGLN